MAKLSIRDLDLSGKKVFIRVDFNVPIEDGRGTDDTRITSAIPTIQYAIDKGARVVLASHLGRPKGQKNLKYTLKPVAEHLAKVLGRPVAFATDCIGEEATSVVNALKDGEVALLENLRFYAEEEKNDAAFSAQLAALCDLYVNDAFGTAHRAHASTAGMTASVPTAAAGFLMEKELRYLVETLLKARGLEIGRSLVEIDKTDLAASLEVAAKEKNVKLLLPVDHQVAANPDDGANARNVDVTATPADLMGLDIGAATASLYAEVIGSAQTIIWNGPMGMFEKTPFDQGTRAVAQAVASASAKSNATSIIGGGDSVAAIHESGLANQITHISTGGGATLELLAGDLLPGVAALTEKN